MQRSVGDRSHDAPGPHQASHEGDHGHDIPVVFQVPARQDEVADARAAKIESRGHPLTEPLEVLADQMARGLEDRGDQGMVTGDHPLELGDEIFLGGSDVETIREQLVNLGIAPRRLIRQCEQSIANVSD